jgi:hypothetical protein
MEIFILQQPLKIVAMCATSFDLGVDKRTCWKADVPFPPGTASHPVGNKVSLPGIKWTTA